MMKYVYMFTESHTGFRYCKPTRISNIIKNLCTLVQCDRQSHLHIILYITLQVKGLKNVI